REYVLVGLLDCQRGGRQSQDRSHLVMIPLRLVANPQVQLLLLGRAVQKQLLQPRLLLGPASVYPIFQNFRTFMEDGRGMHDFLLGAEFPRPNDAEKTISTCCAIRMPKAQRIGRVAPIARLAPSSPARAGPGTHFHHQSPLCLLPKLTNTLPWP